MPTTPPGDDDDAPRFERLRHTRRVKLAPHRDPIKRAHALEAYRRQRALKFAHPKKETT
jgi:hypothetical protein